MKKSDSVKGSKGTKSAEVSVDDRNMIGVEDNDVINNSSENDIPENDIQENDIQEADVDTKKNVPTKKSAEEREREFLAARMADILKKYKNVTPDSIRRETDGHHAGKLTVEITCRNKNRDEDTGAVSECGQTRRVATSDLFQVKVCEDCIAARRAAMRRKKAKLARIAKKKEKEANKEANKEVGEATGGTAVKERKKLAQPKKKMRNVEEVAKEAKERRKAKEAREADGEEVVTVAENAPVGDQAPEVAQETVQEPDQANTTMTVEMNLSS